MLSSHFLFQNIFQKQFSPVLRYLASVLTNLKELLAPEENRGGLNGQEGKIGIKDRRLERKKDFKETRKKKLKVIRFSDEEELRTFRL